MQILLILLTGLFLATSLEAQEAPVPYLSQLLQRAHEAQLANQRNGISCFTIVQIYSAGIRGRQDDPGFSFPDGKMILKLNSTRR